MPSTLTCSVNSSTTGSMISTAWSIRNFRGNSALQAITFDFFHVFKIGGDPRPTVTDPTRTFLNRLTLLNFTAELDGVTLYCGTGQNPEQAVFFLRIYCT